MRLQFLIIGLISKLTRRKLASKSGPGCRVNLNANESCVPITNVFDIYCFSLQKCLPGIASFVIGSSCKSLGRFFIHSICLFSTIVSESSFQQQIFIVSKFSFFFFFIESLIKITYY